MAQDVPIGRQAACSFAATCAGASIFVFCSYFGEGGLSLYFASSCCSYEPWLNPLVDSLKVQAFGQSICMSFLKLRAVIKAFACLLCSYEPLRLQLG